MNILCIIWLYWIKIHHNERQIFKTGNHYKRSLMYYTTVKKMNEILDFLFCVTEFNTGFIELNFLVQASKGHKSQKKGHLGSSLSTGSGSIHFTYVGTLVLNTFFCFAYVTLVSSFNSIIFLWQLKLSKKNCSKRLYIHYLYI